MLWVFLPLGAFHFRTFLKSIRLTLDRQTPVTAAAMQNNASSLKALLKGGGTAKVAQPIICVSPQSLNFIPVKI